VIPQLASPLQIERAERLRASPELEPVWVRLAADVRPIGEPSNDDPYVNLHELVWQLVNPPPITDPPTREQIEAVTAAMRRIVSAYVKYPALAGHVAGAVNGRVYGVVSSVFDGPHTAVRLPDGAEGLRLLIDALEQHDFRRHHGIPLMPAQQRTDTAERNWLALVLRERTIRGLFMHPHHDEVALLMRVAYPEWPPFSEHAVEQLRAW
jgi:hypothetical protein